MKYVPPFGVSDPNASYINGDPSIARKGSIPPAAVFEEPQREIVNLITKSRFFPPDDSDLYQLTKSVRAQYVNYTEDTGSINFLSCSFDPPIGAYTIGLVIRIRVKNSNNGPVTIDAGAGRVNVRRMNGAALAVGDLIANGIAELCYDGTAFQMLNFLGTGDTGEGSVTNYYINLPYTVDTSTTANVIIAPFSPAITTLKAGDAILVKIANNNTAATKITVNALAPITVFAQGGGDLLPDDILAGSVFLFIYDGTNFYVAPNPTINGNYQLNVPTTQFPTIGGTFQKIRRKLINGSLKVKVAAGVFTETFSIDHPNSSRITLEGTMIGAAPYWASFACTGYDASARTNDAYANLAMLRSRYGTEIRAPAGYQGFVISVTEKTFPVIKDLLITATSMENGAGIGANSMSLSNVSVWGFWAGIMSNGSGNIVANSCYACACHFGWDSAAGGTIGAGSCASYGNSHSGVIAESCGFFQANGFYSRGNGFCGYMCDAMALLLLTGSDGVFNYLDLYCANMAHMEVEVNYNTVSPALYTVGNNNALIIPS